MKRPFVILIGLFGVGVVFVASCLPQYTPSPSLAQTVQRQPAMVSQPMSPTATASPTRDVEQDARATMIFLQATDTAVAAEKTEMAHLSIQQTQVQATYDQAIIFTQQANQTAVMGTALATQTQIMGTQQATQTQGIQTAIATMTQSALTASARSTQIVQSQKLYASVAMIWLAFLACVVFAALGIAWAFTMVRGKWLEQTARNIQDSKIEPTEHGFPAVPASALPGGKNEKMVNLNLAHRAVTDVANDDLTVEQALQNAQSQRELDAIRAVAKSVSARKMLAGQTKPTLDPAALPSADMLITKPELGMLPDGNHLPSPSWNLFRSWDGKGGIPYGVSQRGLEQVSIQQVPHGGVFGKTGMGKSRRFLRPFIAGAIASGQRVVIIGKEVDFWPFAQHPNVKMIGVRNVTEEGEAARYADYLKRIVEEMNRRDEILTSRRMATWDRAGFENTLLILDELGNALEMMPSQIRQDAQRWVGGLVREGRKYGFNIWLATQRAVGFKSIVEQLGRAVFYLADADASRHALGFPGAERLSEGQFFAKFQRTQICAAFDPTDDELTAFLQERDVPVHEPINWIEGSVVEEKAEGGRQNAEDAIDVKILQIYKEMKAADSVSLSEIQRQVYGDINTGGAHFRHIQDVVAKYVENATTTGNMPATGALSSSAV